MDPSHVLFYQVTTLILDVKQSKENTATLLADNPSDEFLYEAKMQFLDEEQDNKMATEDVPEPLIQPSQG